MAKKAAAKVRRDLGERIWAALWVDGANGVRKGNKVFRVVEVDGTPVKVARYPTGHVPKVTVRAMRDEDFVDVQDAIKVLEQTLETLLIDAGYEG